MKANICGIRLFDVTYHVVFSHATFHTSPQRRLVPCQASLSFISASILLPHIPGIREHWQGHPYEFLRGGGEQTRPGQLVRELASGL